MATSKKSTTHAFASTLKKFKTASGRSGQYFSLPELAKTYPNVNRLPVSLRIVLESVLRNCDGLKVSPEHVAELANWQPNADRTAEIPFVVARVVLQDFTGVPLLADLAAMRNVAVEQGRNPKQIEPLVPVDLVVDHSVMVDYYGTKDALDLNMKLEFERNNERYEFMKWGMQAFDTFGVVPPGFGIVHQVNLEYLARGVHERGGTFFPDSLVGTDSHTTMINGIGVVGWGVGGIEAEAGMLGQPVYFLTPDVVGDLAFFTCRRENCGARLAVTHEEAEPTGVELTNALDEYLPEDQIADVRRAYEFGAQEHKGQNRTSGEPYIFHPLAVARILAGRPTPPVVVLVSSRAVLGLAGDERERCEQREADHRAEDPRVGDGEGAALDLVGLELLAARPPGQVVQPFGQPHQRQLVRVLHRLIENFRDHASAEAEQQTRSDGEREGAAEEQERRARTAVTVMFLLNGTVFASWVPHIPAVKMRLGLNDGQLGLLRLRGGAVVQLQVDVWLHGLQLHRQRRRRGHVLHQAQGLRRSRRHGRRLQWLRIRHRIQPERRHGLLRQLPDDPRPG